MDVQPIATKEGEDEIGTGTTRVLDGVIMMVTGTDDNGVQIGEFGSSEGYLDENIMWGRPGAPDKGEIFIKTEVIIKEGTNMERPGPLAAHSATDVITQEIREALKKVEDESLVVDTETFNQVRRPGKKKVVIVKEIMGQGAMHDNLILPMEPVGVLGARQTLTLETYRSWHLHWKYLTDVSMHLPVSDLHQKKCQDITGENHWFLKLSMMKKLTFAVLSL